MQANLWNDLFRLKCYSSNAPSSRKPLSTQLSFTLLLTYDLQDKGQNPFLARKNNWLARGWDADEKPVWVTQKQQRSSSSVWERRERGEKKEVVKRCKRREVDCLSALVARIVETAQQTCAAVAVVHGNTLQLILLGGPIRWKRRLCQGKSEGTLHPANIWEELLQKRSRDRRKRSDRADLLPPPSILLVFLHFRASLGTSRD